VLHHAMLTAAAEAESPETGSDLPFGAKEERPLARSPGRSNVRSFALRQRALRRAARVRWVVLAEDDHAFDVPGLVRTLGYLNDSRAFSMGQNGPWIKKPLMKIEWPQIHTAIQVQGRLFAQNAGRKKSHLLEQGVFPHLPLCCASSPFNRWHQRQSCDAPQGDDNPYQVFPFRNPALFTAAAASALAPGMAKGSLRRQCDATG